MIIMCKPDPQMLSCEMHAGAAIHAHLQYIMPPLLTLAGNTSAAAAAVEAAQKTLRSVRLSSLTPATETSSS